MQWIVVHQDEYGKMTAWGPWPTEQQASDRLLKFVREQFPTNEGWRTEVEAENADGMVIHASHEFEYERETIGLYFYQDAGSTRVVPLATGIL